MIPPSMGINAKGDNQMLFYIFKEALANSWASQMPLKIRRPRIKINKLQNRIGQTEK